MVIAFSSKFKFFSFRSKTFCEIESNALDKSRNLAATNSFSSTFFLTLAVANRRTSVAEKNLRNRNCSVFSKLSSDRYANFLLLWIVKKSLDIAEVIEVDRWVFRFSEPIFIENWFFECLFEMVKELSFIQKSVNQVIERFKRVFMESFSTLADISGGPKALLIFKLFYYISGI